MTKCSGKVLEQNLFVAVFLPLGVDVFYRLAVQICCFFLLLLSSLSIFQFFQFYSFVAQFIESKSREFFVSFVLSLFDFISA